MMRQMVFLGVLMVLSSCDEPPEEWRRLPGCMPVSNQVREGMNLNPPSDPFDILDGRINRDCLQLSVGYQGGGSDHSFGMYHLELPHLSAYSGRLTLVHDARGDTGRLWMQKEVYFDLAGLQDSTQNMIRLILEDRDEESGDDLLIDYYY